MILTMSSCFSISIVVVVIYCCIYFALNQSALLVGVAVVTGLAAFAVGFSVSASDRSRAVARFTAKIFPLLRRRLKSKSSSKIDLSRQKHLDVNGETREIVNCIVRDCLQSWYDSVSDCTSPVVDAEILLNYVLQRLLKRLSKVERHRAFCRVVQLYTRHLDVYCQTTRDCQVSSTDDLLLKFEQFRLFYPLRGIDNELAYLTTVTNVIITSLMEQSPINCLVVKELLAQVLAREILLKVINMMSDPKWIYDAVFIILSDDDTNPENSKSMPLLSENVSYKDRKENKISDAVTCPENADTSSSCRHVKFVVPLAEDIISPIENCTTMPVTEDGHIDDVLDEHIDLTVHPYTVTSDDYITQESCQGGSDATKSSDVVHDDTTCSGLHRTLFHWLPFNNSSTDLASTPQTVLVTRRGSSDSDGLASSVSSFDSVDEDAARLSLTGSPIPPNEETLPEEPGGSSDEERASPHHEPDGECLRTINGENHSSTSNSSHDHLDQRDYKNSTSSPQLSSPIAKERKSSGFFLPSIKRVVSKLTSGSMHRQLSLSTSPQLLDGRDPPLGSRSIDPLSLDDVEIIDDVVDEAMEAVEDFSVDEKPERIFDSICITGTEKRQSRSESFTVYVTHVYAWYQLNNDKWHLIFSKVRRRYREFVTLQNVLESNKSTAASLRGINCPSRLTAVPFLANVSSSVVEHRRKSLQQYLQELLMLPSVNNSEELKRFLGYETDASIAFARQLKTRQLPRLDKALVRTLSGVVSKITHIIPNISDTSPTAQSRSHSSLKDISQWTDKDALHLTFSAASRATQSSFSCSCERCTELKSNVTSIVAMSNRSLSNVADDLDSALPGASSVPPALLPVLHVLPEKTSSVPPALLPVLPEEMSSGMSAAVLDLVKVCLSDTESWLNSPTAMNVLQLLVSDFLDLWLKAEFELLTSPAQCALYLNLLRGAIWGSNENQEHRKMSATEELQASRQKARQALADFLPDPIHIVPGRESFSDGIELLLDSVSHQQLNRSFFFYFLDILLEEMFPEIFTESYQQRLIAELHRT